MVETPAGDDKAMIKIGELVLGGGAFAVALFVYIHTLGFPQLSDGHPGPGLFPQVLSIIIGLMGLILIGQNIFVARGGSFGEVKQEEEEDQGQVTWPNFFWVVGAIAFYIAISENLGFILTSIIITFVLMLRLKVIWYKSLPVCIFMSLFIYWLFGRILYVPLPLGVFGH